VPQHVGVRLDPQANGGAGALDHAVEAFRRQRRPRSEMKTNQVDGKRKACWRFSFPRQAMCLLLLIYATIVILLGWWPWHILLLALIAARNPRPSKTVKRAARAP
jgi:hypothetical protein